MLGAVLPEVSKTCPGCGGVARRVPGGVWDCRACDLTWPVGTRHPSLRSGRRAIHRPSASSVRRAERQRRRESERRWIAIGRIALVLIPVLWFAGCQVASGIETARVQRDAREQAAREQAFLDSLPAAVTWASLGMACGDGWPSPSLGKQGACSHHGGAVWVYRSAQGEELRCPRGGPPTTSIEQYHQRESPLCAGHYWCS